MKIQTITGTGTQPLTSTLAIGTATKTTTPASVFEVVAQRLETAPTYQSWQQGMPPSTGRKADYGFGTYELRMVKHGQEVVLSYPKSNGIPEIEVDVQRPFSEQVDAVSKQMVALQNGPALELVEKYIKSTRLRPTFDVDVQVNGQTINLAKAKPDSLTPDTVNAALVEIVKQKTFKNVRADVAAFYGVKAAPGTTTSVSGERALQKLLEVLERAIELSDKGFGPPLPKGKKRRQEYIDAVKAFAVRNLFHGENLTIKHQVQGFDVFEKNPELNETLGHDIIDRMSIQAVLQLDAHAFEPLWARAWVLEEVQNQAPTEYAKLAGALSPEEAASKVDPDRLAELCRAHAEWTLNANAGEPRYVLAMYHWGDQRSDADKMMNWHRIVNHHDGDLAAGSLLIEQKNQNGIEHHAGTEHEGVRHEVSMGYDLKDVPFGRTILKIGSDSAFKGLWSQWALKKIVFQRLLQERGIITPEQLAHSPNRELYLKLDAAYQSLQSINVAADRALRSLAPKVAPPIQTAIDAIANNSKPQLPVVQTIWRSVQRSIEGVSAEEAASTLQYFEAKMLQLAVRSPETVAAFVPLAQQAHAAVAALGGSPAVKLPSPDLEEMQRQREQLEALPAAAKEARAGHDTSLAVVYDAWNDAVTAGFPSLDN